jgi:hypothetical protein
MARAEFSIGEPIEHTAVNQKTERERGVGGIAADQTQAERAHELGSGGIVRVHKDQNVQVLRFGPERIEVLAVIVTMVNVGGDIGAAEIELGDCVIQNPSGPRRFLDRHRGHRCKTPWIAVDKTL